MFVLVTGKPRSGKTAYAVDFMLRKQKDYYNIYSNVNGLKMQDNIKPLNFNEILSIMEHCKMIYDNQIAMLGDNLSSNVIDDPIIDYLLDIKFIVLNPAYAVYLTSIKEREAKSYFNKLFLNFFKPIAPIAKYKPTLLIIDEAQNHFGAEDKITGKKASVDPVIVWWISYHGHLFTDVFLLSQNYKKIHPAYLYDIEYFLNAFSSKLQLFTTKFKYNHYVATPYHKTNIAKKEYVKKRKEIFEAYESGDKVRTKSLILPLLGYSLLGLIVVSALFTYIAYGLTSSDNNSVKTSQNQNHIQKANTQRPDTHIQVIEEQISFSKLKYIKLICIKNTCQNKKNNISLEIDDLQDLLKNTQSTYLRSNKFGNGMAVVYVLASSDFLGLFNKGAENEKRKNFNILN